MSVLPDQIPGYSEAVEREQFIRDAAFLPVNERLEGFEVVPLTMRHYLILRAMRSPFLTGQAANAIDVANFLWLFSPTYDPANKRAKAEVMRRCRHFVGPAKPLLRTAKRLERWRNAVIAASNATERTAEAIRNFISETFMDSPPTSATVQFQPSYFSDAACLCAVMGREYGWDDETTMRKPLSRLFQYVNEIKSRNGNPALFNPSDKVLGEGLDQQNKAAEAAAEASLGSANL